MKVVTSKIDLVNAIGKIQSIVPLKPSTPIVGNVLLEAIDDQLVVSGTDLTLSMRCHIEAKVIEQGSIALPARRFFQLIRELTSPQIKISAETTDIAEITTGTSVFRIHGMNKNEFPHFPELSGAPDITLTHQILKEMLSKTAFSAAKEDTRYALNGVQIQIADQKITFTGTDGKRLAKTETEVLAPSSLYGSYVIPLKGVEEMIKTLGDTDSPISLRLSHDKVSLETNSLILTTKLLVGQYPDVAKVIPSQLGYKFAIHREELIALLRQISLFTSETTQSVRFTFETGQLHLMAMNNSIGEGRVSMPVDYSGNKMDIAFNPFFFLDILRHIKDETFQFGLNDTHNPGLITDSTKALFVLMPMRLNDVTPATETSTVNTG